GRFHLQVRFSATANQVWPPCPPYLRRRCPLPWVHQPPRSYQPSPPPQVQASYHHSDPINLNPNSMSHPNTSYSSMKPMKLDLPRFYGEDPYGWLAMAERFLDYHEVEDHRKVMVAAMHLGGDAALWMKWFESRYPRDSWVVFSDMLL
ncbi:unnamed protein product, partial [Prunus brigantina]